MIKYYTYYSCGGYKDIYIGSDQDHADASYFIPLLNVWRKSNKPENVEKIVRAESVQQVELISKSNSAGFPSECNLMFSHGGYKSIYRTLMDGRACLCIRDIPNGTKDEEGRDIPFNFMFLADGPESIERLDGLALEYLYRSSEIDSMIANAITYDPAVNGIKFDLVKFDSLLSTSSKSHVALYHKAGVVDYLLIASRNQALLALKEQELDERRVNSQWDFDGEFHGSFRYITEPADESLDDNMQKSSTDTSLSKQTSANVDLETTKGNAISGTVSDIVDPIAEENHEKNDMIVCDEETKGNISDSSKINSPISQVLSNIDFRIQQIEQRLSLLVTAEDIAQAQSMFKKVSEENHSMFNIIQNKLNDIQGFSSTMPIIAQVQNDKQPIWKNKYYQIGFVCLLVGIILGALIL